MQNRYYLQREYILPHSYPYLRHKDEQIFRGYLKFCKIKIQLLFCFQLLLQGVILKVFRIVIVNKSNAINHCGPQDIFPEFFSKGVTVSQNVNLAQYINYFILVNYNVLTRKNASKVTNKLQVHSENIEFFKVQFDWLKSLTSYL